MNSQLIKATLSSDFTVTVNYVAIGVLTISIATVLYLAKKDS